MGIVGEVSFHLDHIAHLDLGEAIGVSVGSREGALDQGGIGLKLPLVADLDVGKTAEPDRVDFPIDTDSLERGVLEACLQDLAQLADGKCPILGNHRPGCSCPGRR